MTKVTEALNIIQTEEVNFNASISESTLTRVGAVSNLIAARSNKAFDFKFLGPFKKINGGEDGARVFIWDSQIVGISGHIRLSGASGTTVIDIHKIDTDGTDLGTILSTKISITSAAVDGVVFYTNFLDASENSPTGITNGINTNASSLIFNQGQGLRVDIQSIATAQRDLTINAHYRPYTS